jgi:hypothetical protein
MWCINTTQYYSILEKEVIFSFVTAENNMLNELSQVPKVKCYIILFIYGNKNGTQRSREHKNEGYVD